MMTIIVVYFKMRIQVYRVSREDLHIEISPEKINTS